MPVQLYGHAFCRGEGEGISGSPGDCGLSAHSRAEDIPHHLREQEGVWARASLQVVVPFTRFSSSTDVTQGQSQPVSRICAALPSGGLAAWEERPSPGCLNSVAVSEVPVSLMCRQALPGPMPPPPPFVRGSPLGPHPPRQSSQVLGTAN